MVDTEKPVYDMCLVYAVKAIVFQPHLKPVQYFCHSKRIAIVDIHFAVIAAGFDPPTPKPPAAVLKEVIKLDWAAHTLGK